MQIDPRLASTASVFLLRIYSGKGIVTFGCIFHMKYLHSPPITPSNQNNQTLEHRIKTIEQQQIYNKIFNFFTKTTANFCIMKQFFLLLPKIIFKMKKIKPNAIYLYCVCFFFVFLCVNLTGL